MNDPGFADKAAFVTGGASGIGEATVRRLIEAGARVAIADANAAKASALAGELGRGAMAITLDVRDADATAAAVDQACAALGPVRLQVNCAGVTGNGFAMGAIPSDEWRNVMAINLDGVFNAMNAAFPAMAKAGGGAIVNVSSVMGTVAVGRFAAYTAAKHALLGLTKSAAIDGAVSGIRVNSVGPGYIDTPLQDGRMDEARRADVAARHPLNRWGTADEVAALIVWLLSDQASFVTGSHHLVDGGYTAV